MSVLANESAEPVTSRNQLVDYFAKAAKPKAEWLVGCENEMFPYRLAPLQPLHYDEPNGVRDFLIAMGDFGWKPVEEDGHVIGLQRGLNAISLEPGSYVELASAPFRDLHETAAAIDQYLVEANQIGERLGIGLLSMGFHPTARREDISWTPKKRYEIMRNYMAARGKLGHDMMLRTCAAQVNLDFSDEADMVKKFRVALALQPVATVLFASSPFTEGKPNGYLSYRMQIWTDVDADRCGAPAFVFEDGFGYERYADYALGVPMYFIYRNGKYIDCAGQSFRDFMEGRLPALPGEKPTLADWANHLTTIFTDVRLKKVLELRGADSGPGEMLLALPALWVGLLYDADVLDSAWDLVKGWSPSDHAQVHADAPRLGFEAEIRGIKLRDLAQSVLTLAKQGLRRRANRLHGGADETRYLDILFDSVASHQSMADRLLMRHKYEKDFSMQAVFDACRLLPPPEREREE